MRILGIDPGLAIVGFGVVEQQQRGKLCLVDYGTVTTPAGMPLPDRLVIVHDGIKKVVETYRPDMIALEELFFCKNVTTAIAVGQARGAAVIAARNAFGGKLYEYTPKQIKLAVTGYGNADKRQVQQMVRILLQMDHIPKPDDAADALAIAICHAQCCRVEGFEIQ
ncbi:MAG: crossover junction endodeoxyribonuclease RuvC [Eubacteriales bacterium]|nr:crossover junction endodeoxyribonuclease RuvC [Eubacteriales bacterium]